MPEKRNDLFVVEVLIAIIVPLLAWGGMGGIGMMGYGGGAMMLVYIIFIILLMIIVYFLLSTMMPTMTGSR